MSKPGAIKPCPFCNGYAEPRQCLSHLPEFIWSVVCRKCNTSSPNLPSEAQAIAAWNRRTQVQSPAVVEVPAGYAVVPRVPTEAMHVAAVRTIVRCSGNDDFPPRVWAAMLRAAPTQQGAAPQGCTRSHPHENMDAECEAKTVAAREANRLAQQGAKPSDALCDAIISLRSAIQGAGSGDSSTLAGEAATAREHIPSSDCWCQPEADTVDPDTGATVYVHRGVQ